MASAAAIKRGEIVSIKSRVRALEASDREKLKVQSEVLLRVAAVEEKQQEIEELVNLLKQVRAALRVFIALCDGFKYVMGVGAALGVTWFGIKTALK